MSISPTSSNSDYSAVYQQMMQEGTKEYANQANQSNKETEKQNQKVWAEYAQGN